jgi:hypothetical protein
MSRRSRGSRHDGQHERGRDGPTAVLGHDEQVEHEAALDTVMDVVGLHPRDEADDVVVLGRRDERVELSPEAVAG